MDFFTSMDISASALAAERTRMNLISSNLANVNSTRTAEGGPYRRKDAVFTATPLKEAGSFGAALSRANDARSVQVTQVNEDPRPPRMQYEPGHPDADPNGYVAYPNINVVEEMADMITASRSYEANITATNAAKSMALKTLDLLR
ncbi:MAG: flagellar basal body rod protein FlgC [Geobacter sp.]|jgi:flagellar basal-body rod protein FlgC|uniref:flagellar basal body rod protein FlgC n=1 Tax=Geomonas ferrireducens TaxID=2570227 RepID=UPI0010A895EA|nr:flagellar basal body rod protein FlgC [Geomonas ferrireducens]TSK04602.1 MAG: flagellar basal body rod protein FlgC [Geobacter sp.]